MRISQVRRAFSPATGGDWIFVRSYPAVFIGPDIPSWSDRSHDSILVGREDSGLCIGPLIDRRAGVALQPQVATGKIHKIDICRPAVLITDHRPG